jgi:hypothetical protein
MENTAWLNIAKFLLIFDSGLKDVAKAIKLIHRFKDHQLMLDEAFAKLQFAPNFYKDVEIEQMKRIIELIKEKVPEV